jgi:hypothetical protein
VVPSFAFEGFMAGELGEVGGDGGDEGEFTLFGQDEEQVLVGEEDELAGPVAAAFPPAGAVGEVDAGKHAAIETVGVGAVDEVVVEGGSEFVGSPLLGGGPRVVFPRDVEAARRCGRRCGRRC